MKSGGGREARGVELLSPATVSRTVSVYHRPSARGGSCRRFLLELWGLRGRAGVHGREQPRESHPGRLIKA